LRARRRRRHADEDDDDDDGGGGGEGGEKGGNDEEDDGDDELPRDVLVQFGMTEAGELRVKVVDDDFGGGVSGERSDNDGDRGPTREEQARQTFLAVAIGVLGLLYLALRLFLRPRTDHGDAATLLFSHAAAEATALRGEAEL
jgi:hypothetical protein